MKKLTGRRKKKIASLLGTMDELGAIYERLNSDGYTSEDKFMQDLYDTIYSIESYCRNQSMGKVSK